jgi:hypothetical protein
MELWETSDLSLLIGPRSRWILSYTSTCVCFSFQSYSSSGVSMDKEYGIVVSSWVTRVRLTTLLVAEKISDSRVWDGKLRKEEVKMNSVLRLSRTKKGRHTQDLLSFPYSWLHINLYNHSTFNPFINRSDGSVVRAPRRCVLQTQALHGVAPFFSKGPASISNRGDRGFDSYSLHSIFAPLTYSW